MVVIIGLVVVFALLWFKTVKMMYVGQPRRKLGLNRSVNHSRISKVSHRQFGAWDPELGNKSGVHEPLIDQATKLVEETASREFKFKGTHQKPHQMMVVENMSDLKSP